MKWSVRFVWAAVLIGFATAADSTTYKDPTTGFVFSQYDATYKYMSSNVISIKTAFPSPASSPYDTVVQITAPKEVGWVGIAWGGSMVNAPLTVAWPSGTNVIVSSRWATQHAQPAAYTGETLQVLTKGTSVTSTSWQVTLKCAGCTSWVASGRTTSLNPTGSNRLAYAYSASAPVTPSSNTSNLVVHDLFAYWSHDFNQGANANFADLVSANA